MSQAILRSFGDRGLIYGYFMKIIAYKNDMLLQMVAKNTCTKNSVMRIRLPSPWKSVPCDWQRQNLKWIRLQNFALHIVLLYVEINITMTMTGKDGLTPTVLESIFPMKLDKMNFFVFFRSVSLRRSQSWWRISAG